MIAADIREFVFENGLTLLVQPMPDVQTAALALMAPAGGIHQPPGLNGVSAVLSDLITRGAGDRDSRQLTAAFDRLGVQRNESVGWNFITFGAASLADKLRPALELYADILLRPRLPESEFPGALAGVEQGLLALDDEPQRKAMVELRRRCYDAPWGLHSDGDLDDLPKLTHADVARHYQRCVTPRGTILGVAGNVDPDAVRDWVEQLFGGWRGADRSEVVRGSRGPRVDHIQQDSAQTHIGIAYDAVPYGHDDYYAAWAAVSILSGGSSSRLFTEVRERRGLCYSVNASLNSLLTEARVLAYAGTTVERAQETLDVTLREMRRLGEGVEADELDRCKARAKSALVMSQEAAGSRAGVIARDWFHLGRVTSPDEVRERIDAITTDQVRDYALAWPARDVTVLTVGPAPLNVAE